jgi:glycine betaine catabolism A
VHEDAVEGRHYDPTTLIEFMHRITLQDKALCRIAQQGVSSYAYDNSAPYHPVFEPPVRGFIRTYLGHVAEERARRSGCPGAS